MILREFERETDARKYARKWSNQADKVVYLAKSIVHRAGSPKVVWFTFTSALDVNPHEGTTLSIMAIFEPKRGSTMHSHLAGPWKSLAALKQANAAAGMHWFQPATMRFFRTKIAGDIVAGRYFITSEQHEHRDRTTGELQRGQRRYSIRIANDDASIYTVGKEGLLPERTTEGFMQFGSLRAARAYLNKHLGAQRKAVAGVPDNPVRAGYDRDTIGRNIAELVHEGRPQKQAIAIALRSARASFRRSHPRGALPKHLRGGK